MPSTLSAVDADVREVGIFGQNVGSVVRDARNLLRNRHNHSTNLRVLERDEGGRNVRGRKDSRSRDVGCSGRGQLGLDQVLVDVGNFGIEELQGARGSTTRENVKRRYSVDH